MLDDLGATFASRAVCREWFCEAVCSSAAFRMPTAAWWLTVRAECAFDSSGGASPLQVQMPPAPDRADIIMALRSWTDLTIKGVQIWSGLSSRLKWTTRLLGWVINAALDGRAASNACLAREAHECELRVSLLRAAIAELAAHLPSAARLESEEGSVWERMATGLEEPAMLGVPGEVDTDRFAVRVWENNARLRSQTEALALKLADAADMVSRVQILLWRC